MLRSAVRSRSGLLEPQQEETVLAWGASLITPGNDLAFLSAAARQSLDRLRQTIDTRGDS